MPEADFPTSEELKAIGLNEREARVYLALLETGSATASRLSLATRIPQNKIYLLLESLVESGYCQRQRSGRQSHFSVVDPSVAMSAPLKDLESHLEQTRCLAQTLADRFAALPTENQTLVDVETLRHKDAIRQRYLQLLQSTSEEVAGFSRGPYAYENREDLEQQFGMGRLVDDRCQSRWVYELDAERDPMLVEFLLDYPGVGDIRVAPALPLKFVLFDRQTAIFADEEASSPEDLSVAIIRHPTIISVFFSLFEYFWNSSEDFQQWYDQL